MISNPNQLFYTCIAKGTVILADFASKEEAGIESVALRCLENTPPCHSIFSHTVRKKTYSFLIDDSFVYFAIFDECIEKSESFWLLNRLKSVMEGLIRDGLDPLINPSPRCLQSNFDPIFTDIVRVDVDLELDMDLIGSPRSVARESRNLSIDSSKGRRVAVMPLLGNPLKVLKKKKKKKSEDISDAANETLEKNGNNGVLRKELRNGLLSDHHHRQKVKQMWKKHVWMVLMVDFCVCAVLFGIWLWICEGFHCING